MGELYTDMAAWHLVLPKGFTYIIVISQSFLTERCRRQLWPPGSRSCSPPGLLASGSTSTEVSSTCLVLGPLLKA